MGTHFRFGTWIIIDSSTRKKEKVFSSNLVIFRDEHRLRPSLTRTQPLPYSRLHSPASSEPAPRQCISRTTNLRSSASICGSFFAEAPSNKDSDRINRMDRINPSIDPVNPVNPVQSGSSFGAAPDINYYKFIKYRHLKIPVPARASAAPPVVSLCCYVNECEWHGTDGFPRIFVSVRIASSAQSVFYGCFAFSRSAGN